MLSISMVLPANEMHNREDGTGVSGTLLYQQHKDIVQAKTNVFNDCKYYRLAWVAERGG